ADSAGVQGVESNPPAGASHPDELVGRLLLVRREHRPEDRADDVELAVAERQGLCVAIDERGVEAFVAAPPTGPVEERGDVVDADDLATAACRGQGRVAAA